ncbi:hypothetical protein [Hymenobacter pini]|uniref:hypothetical protein n=1 Tax=Hymenobacter pini TaxID=2880879 RepID=UPI001CF3CA13|nr:hypothetical protein [Hymenobacter pini]MCA8831164.1 hypothetical protein [Hymenobacter pini]
MRNLFTRNALFALLLAGPATLTSCEKEPYCGCTPPPVEPVTSASLTRVNTWWLNELSSGSQISRSTDIKDRFSLQFQPDGSYTQTLLADGTTFNGTWMLMGANNRTLHFTDHKGDAQEYTIEGAGTETMVYSRKGKDGQTIVYAFGATRK